MEDDNENYSETLIENYDEYQPFNEDNFDEEEIDVYDCQKYLDFIEEKENNNVKNLMKQEILNDIRNQKSIKESNTSILNINNNSDVIGKTSELKIENDNNKEILKKKNNSINSPFLGNNENKSFANKKFKFNFDSDKIKKDEK